MKKLMVILIILFSLILVGALYGTGNRTTHEKEKSPLAGSCHSDFPSRMPPVVIDPAVSFSHQ